MSKKYCQQCPVCNEFTDNLIIHVNSHFEKETFDNKSQVLRNKSELPIISENNVLTILKCTDKQSLISKNKNRGSDEEQRQKAQTAQKDLLIPQSIEDTLLAAETAQEDFLLAQALQEEEKNDILNKCDCDFLIAFNLQNHEDTVHEKTTLEAESASIFNKYKNDFLLASELQSYENIVNEKEDFKKLQAMYGMNSSSGFMKQFDARVRKDVGKYITVSDYYKKKSDMLSSLMEGKDNLETSTKGIIDALKNQYVYGVVGVKTFKLCCNVTHFGISIVDRGWGCGYRNIQMLISSLFEHDQYKLKETMPDIPSIPKIQALIEKAWSEGYDPTGKEQLDGKLQGTRKWIGTTEVCALLRSLKLKAQIVDFHKPNENLHVLMMKWICDYFQNGLKLPLYLQHQGHSRLCIGIEEHKDKECFLLLLDPSTNVKQMQSFISLQNQKNMIKHFRKSIKQLRQKEFQILYIDGAINIPKEIQESKYISSIRIP